MEILTGEQMRRVDRRAIDRGIPGLQLMETAGGGLARALLDDHPDLTRQRVLILCGKGNNGGDGLVAARHLHAAGVAAEVVLLAAPTDLRDDAAVQLGALRARGGTVREAADESSWAREGARLDERTLVVDALLGTGVRGGARGLVARAIEDLNASVAHVVSVDLPSGLDADSWRIPGVAVRARHTYTLCRPKLPLLFEPAASCSDGFTVIAIGIPDEAVRAEGADLEWLDAAAARALMPQRPRDAHKGTMGHLLVVAGSPGKGGAAVLVARGALRAGVGLVTVAAPRTVRPWIACQQAEMMTEALPETAQGTLGKTAVDRAAALLTERDALALGPGLGTAPGTRACVRSLLDKRRLPAVLDADGLNAFAGRSAPKLRSGRHPLVLTPHPGEAGRLLGSSARAVQDERLAAVRALSRRTGATVVLKGHRTLVADPSGRVAVNASGNPGLATGGSGDVLTGMIGAFLARGLEAGAAARLAVFAHGDAGDRAARQRGPDGMIASDVTERIPAALRGLAASPPMRS